ncbi:MAG: hypothetical protein WCP35_01055 [Verrucomicrobiota bacterium]
MLDETIERGYNSVRLDPMPQWIDLTKPERVLTYASVWFTVRPQTTAWVLGFACIMFYPITRNRALDVRRQLDERIANHGAPQS